MENGEFLNSKLSILNSKGNMGITTSIDITPKQRKTILSLLARHIPSVAVWAYGSRLKWTSRPESDLDLIVFSVPEQRGRISALKEAFEESSLPLRVDVLIWDEVPDDFRKNIQKNYVVLVEKPRGKKGSLGSDVRSEWTETRLEDITTILGDGLHGTPKYKKNGEYFFINGNNLSNGKIVINEKTKRASYEEYLKYKKELNDRTILVSINGTLGNIAFYSGEKVFLGKSACYFNLIGGVDKRFVRHVLSSKYFNDYIDTYATGTTIKNVSLKTMREFTFNLPPLPEQQQIANILSALDDKIELNRQINQTLEQMAQAIFKSWFVDFLPVKAKIKAKEELRDKNRELKILNSKFSTLHSPLSIHNSDLFPDELVESELGLIPKGWEVKAATYIADVAIGKTPPRKESQWFSESRSDLKWISIKDMGACGVYLLNTNEYLTSKAVAKFHVRRTEVVNSFETPTGLI